jgi:hypothetical protein
MTLYKSIMVKIKDATKNSGWENRNIFRENFSFAIPSDEAISAIKDFSCGNTILEIGSGIGLWAKLLHEKSVDIIATDPEEKKWKHFQSERWFNVECLDAIKAIEKYKPKVLMTVWPSYSELWTGQALQYFCRNGGKKVIYIGEDSSGCTGNDLFHRILEKCFEKISTIYIPQWEGIHDSVFLMERKYKATS